MLIPKKTFGENEEVQRKSTIIDKKIKINNDVFEYVETINNKGNIVGDFFIIGKKIFNEGIVHGDILGIHYLTDISGITKGNVRVLTNRLNITGDVHKNISVCGKEVILHKGGNVDGSITMVGDKMKIDGLVSTDVRGKVDTLTITGTIKGNVDIQANNIIFGTTGKVKGDLNYTSIKEIPMPKSNIHGSVNHKKKENLVEKLEVKKKIKIIKIVKLSLEFYMKILKCI